MYMFFWIVHRILGSETCRISLWGKTSRSPKQRSVDKMVREKKYGMERVIGHSFTCYDGCRSPAMILIHLGSNDIGTIKTFNLIENIETDILRLKLLFPNCLIIWSELFMRRYWHNAKKGTALEKARKRVNCAIKNFVLSEGNCEIRHPNIRAWKKTLFRHDGVHLSDIGNDIIHNNIQAELETFISSTHTCSFPAA